MGLWDNVSKMGKDIGKVANDAAKAAQESWEEKRRKMRLPKKNNGLRK